MKSKLQKKLLLLFLINSVIAFAQDNRSQIPSFLQKTYFEVNAGGINYPFGEMSLEPEYRLESVNVPHPAARLVLFGYEFNKYLSAQITYMRPVWWVKYNYNNLISTQSKSHSVWMNVGGLTVKPTLPLGKKLSVYGEAGLGLITRHGFEDNITKDTVVSDARFGTFLFGAGLRYHLNDHWALQVCSNFSPQSKKHKQPYTSFLGAGFAYKFGKYSEEKVKKTEASGIIHPKQWLQLGYTSNVLGYGVNEAVSDACIFWGGYAKVRQGLSLNYQRNVFHGTKLFALDWGVNASYWQTNKNREDFFTLSVFPVFRLNFLHSKPMDAYFYYSVAGPCYISKIIIDGENTGAHFTFQDTMGAGIFFGKNRNYNAELKIGHYSNGNTYPDNDAVMVPLSLNVGYAF